jgi:hypothetical protein
MSEIFICHDLLTLFVNIVNLMKARESLYEAVIMGVKMWAVFD